MHTLSKGWVLQPCAFTRSSTCCKCSFFLCISTFPHSLRSPESCSTVGSTSLGAASSPWLTNTQGHPSSKSWIWTSPRPASPCRQLKPGRFMGSKQVSALLFRWDGMGWWIEGGSRWGLLGLEQAATIQVSVSDEPMHLLLFSGAWAGQRRQREITLYFPDEEQRLGHQLHW